MGIVQEKQKNSQEVQNNFFLPTLDHSDGKRHFPPGCFEPINCSSSLLHTQGTVFVFLTSQYKMQLCFPIRFSESEVKAFHRQAETDNVCSIFSLNAPKHLVSAVLYCKNTLGGQ